MDHYFIRTSTMNGIIHYFDGFNVSELKAELRSFAVDEELISKFTALNDTNVIFTNLFRYEMIVTFNIPSKVTYAIRLQN